MGKPGYSLNVDYYSWNGDAGFYFNDRPKRASARPFRNVPIQLTVGRPILKKCSSQHAKRDTYCHYRVTKFCKCEQIRVVNITAVSCNNCFLILDQFFGRRYEKYFYGIQAKWSNLIFLI